MIRKIQIFSSFEAQKKQEIQDVLATPILERIAQTVSLIRKVYAVDFQKSSSSKRIIFIKKTL